MTSAAVARGAWVEALVHELCFGGGVSTAHAPLTFGAELELLAFDARDHRIAPIAATPDAPCSLDVVRDAATRLLWRETISDKGVPRFVGARGGALTFEPGGQLEYASAVHHSIDGVLRELCAVETTLKECADRAGIELLTYGVDPYNSAEHAALQLTATRYSRMASYFAGIGPDGARMMRQTASLQINIGGVDAVERWPIANALAPWLIALFANSPRYAGMDAGCASYRSETWRGVDPSRTGVFDASDPVREYAAFALGAHAFLADDTALPFGALDDDRSTESALAAHLSTLFPEVRPRGYLELRSLDAIPHRDRVAAMTLVAGLLGDADAARDALALVGPADETALRSAGRHGALDPAIRGHASRLVDIAMAGCRRLGAAIASEQTLERARDRLGEILG